jgi:hypothetical protein
VKKLVFSIILVLAATGSSSRANSDSEAPEFYFTRLVYTNNDQYYGRDSWTMPAPTSQFTCPELGGSTFFPQQGWGWAIDYPGADCKLMWGIHRLTNLRVHPNPNAITAMDEDLFRYPYLYAVSPGAMFINAAEAARLREYLLRGGFLHVDDFWGLRQLGNFAAQMRKIFPDRPLERLKTDHEVFHTFFDVESVMQIPNVRNGCYGGRTWEQPDDIYPAVLGISDDNGRLMVIVTYNSDLGDAWEYMDMECYPSEFSTMAYRMGLNFMIYAMTH